MPSGNKTGSLQTIASLGGVTGNTNLSLSGSNNPAYGVTAPAGLVGTITTQSAGTLSVSDPNLQLTAGNYAGAFVALFWLTAAGTILNACYDCTISSFSATSGTDSITLTGGSSTPTGAKYWASSGSAPGSIPANATAITLAVNQDITDGVSIPGGTGANIQQLLATSTQCGLIEWLKASGSTQERLSAFTAPGQFDTWPTTAAQLGSLPTGGSGNNWTSSDTVTDIRCYNAGSTMANIGVSSATASMNIAALLA